MIVAGFGHRTGASAESLRAALRLASEGLTIAALAAPDDKRALVEPLAEALDLPFIAVSPTAIAAIDTPTQSPASIAARGAGSVAEASALVAAGGGARLLVIRLISPDRMASCAIAQGIRA